MLVKSIFCLIRSFTEYKRSNTGYFRDTYIKQQGCSGHISEVTDRLGMLIPLPQLPSVAQVTALLPLLNTSVALGLLAEHIPLSIASLPIVTESCYHLFNNLLH